MKISIHDTYSELSKAAATAVIEGMKDRDHPLICVASGDSPSGLYKELVEMVDRERIPVENWSFVGLDEWRHMNGKDQGSCRFHLDKQFFNPLKIPTDQIAFFDGRSRDPLNECKRIEDFIESNGGIDVAVLGLGMNGHIGMNEPGTPRNTRSHVARLDALTQQVGQKYFSSQQQLSEGLTLGIDTLMESRLIVLVVNGEHKATIVKKMLEEEESEQIPATLFRDHPNFIIFLDKEAAALLQTHD